MMVKYLGPLLLSIFCVELLHCVQFYIVVFLLFLIYPKVCTPPKDAHCMTNLK